MEKNMDIMVVFAHPDDAEFGAAGSVAKWTRQGKRVVYVACTSGDKGTGDPEMTPERLGPIREAEQEAAARVLGVSEVVFLRYPDQGLEDTPGFRKEIVRQIRRFRPEKIVTSDPYRRYIWHRDHRIAGQVTLDAVFPFARDRLAYPDLIREGLMPHKVRELLFWHAEKPNLRLDVGETFDLKVKALRCHESQVLDYGKSEIEEKLGKWCREMAGGSDYELAESFYRVVAPD